MARIVRIAPLNIVRVLVQRGRAVIKKHPIKPCRSSMLSGRRIVVQFSDGSGLIPCVMQH